MQYESPTSYGIQVMAKVKVLVHATDADTSMDGRAMTLAPRTYLSRLVKNKLQQTVRILQYGYLIVHICSSSLLSVPQ